MNFRILECAQRSDEWFAARAGRVTGSRAADVCAKIRAGEAAARRDYRIQLAVERITNRSMDDGGYINAEMQRGIDLEPKAREEAEKRLGLTIRTTGFIVCDDLPVGCSLDGDAGEFASIVEIKCPKSATHVAYLKAGVLPPQYRPQVMHNLLVTGARSCHFVSYDDRLPSGLDFFHVEVAADSLPIAEYADDLHAFIADVDDEYKSLVALRSAA